MCAEADDPSMHDKPLPVRPRTYVLSGGRPRQKLGLSTPWARQGASQEVVDGIEALIPDGYQLGVAVRSNKSRYIFEYGTLGPDRRVDWKMEVSYGIGLKRAAEFALRHHKVIE